MLEIFRLRPMVTARSDVTSFLVSFDQLKKTKYLGKD